VAVADGRVILATDLLFVPRTLRISPEGEARLAAVVQALGGVASGLPGELPWMVRVEGHTDNLLLRPGSDFSSNIELAAARAAEVAEFMLRRGVPGERLAAAGLGQFQPLDPANTAEARARNRRVEVRLVER
jgi:chemotaxis protein MotB